MKPGGSDALVIRVQEFQALLWPIIEEIDAERDEWIAGGHSNRGRRNRSPSGFIERFGGRTYIANQVGVTDAVVRALMRRTEGFVGLTMVDRWLTALGLPHEVKHLHLVPNPQWSPERWQRWAEKNGHC